jgi:hypothetical protein
LIDLAGMAGALVAVPGVVAVSLGGSRARGADVPGSDWDVGVYYRAPLDVPALTALAVSLADVPVSLAGPGGWGPWVDGGGWLTVGGESVDWILRDLDRVWRVWEDCQAGRFTVAQQHGHPLGFYSPCYAGEVALGRVLADPLGALVSLQSSLAAVGYPPLLRASLVAAASEATFTVAGAAKAAARGDVLYVTLCLSRAVGVLVQALFGWQGQWCLNEKGALATVAGLAGTPPWFAPRARALLGCPGSTPGELAATVTAAAALTTETRAVLAGPAPR